MNELARVAPLFRCPLVRRRIQACADFLLALFLLLLLPNQVFAHAVLVHSTPKAHETVASGELNAELQFNSRIDAVRCSQALLMSDGQVKKLAQLHCPHRPPWLQKPRGWNLGVTCSSGKCWPTTGI